MSDTSSTTKTYKGADMTYTEDHHDSRDETLITPVPPTISLSASAQAYAEYKPPFIVRVARWFAAPFSENFDSDRRQADRRGVAPRRTAERRGALDMQRREGDR